MKKLFLLFTIPLFFSCNFFQNKIIDQWGIYEEGEKVGILTFNADNTGIVAHPTNDYEPDTLTWKIIDDKSLCVQFIFDEEEMCGSINWKDNDSFSVDWDEDEEWITVFKKEY
tara:strand:+ start:583 stop:921 length:339 start_codon:yes stop_codon:yes gene_type:complete